MALSTYQWQPPDTSWVGQLVMAGARMRQAEEARSQAAMAQLRQEQARQAEAEKRMAFEAENAARLGQQFNILQGFKENQARFDNSRLMQKDKWEAADREGYDPGALPPSQALSGGAEPFTGADPLPPASTPTPETPASPFMGPPMPPEMQPTREAPAPLPPPPKDGETMVTPPLGVLPDPPPLRGSKMLTDSIDAPMGALRQQLRGIPKGEAHKTIADTARALAVQSAKPPSASLGGQIRTLPNGDFVIGNSVYRTDPISGQTVRVGVAPQAGGVLTDADGNTVVPMRNGKFLVNGVVMDSPPGPLNKLPGATEVRRADLAEDKEARQAEQGATRLQQSAAAQQDRDLAKQKEELFKSVEAARREADRAQTDLEQLRKNSIDPPTIGADGKYRKGQRELADKEEYDRLLKKYTDYKAEEDALQKRMITNRVEAASAQKQLDAMQQGRKPNEEAKPAVPGAQAPATPPAAPAPSAKPAKTIWRKAPDGTLWEYDEATKKPTGKYVPGK